MIEKWIGLSILSVVTLGAGLLLVNNGNLGLGLIGSAIVIALQASIEQAARYQKRDDREAWRGLVGFHWADLAT